MSKVLKVIVNLFLVCAIVIAAAILVPPLLGVSTTVIDSSSTETNLSVGSVTYSKDENIANITVGDKILHESDARVYAYEIQAVDAENSKYTVADYKNKEDGTQELTLRNTVSKIIVSVPLIGYIMIAMHSVEGLIIIALVVLFIIILFILAELWKKSDKDDEEDEDGDEENGNAKMQVTADPSKQFEEDRALEQAQEELSKSMAQDADAETQAAAQPETETKEAAQPEADTKEAAQPETEMQEAAQPEAETQAEEAGVSEEPAETETQPETESEEEDKESFVPVERASAKELLKRAEEAGEQPEITKNEELGITILDYTNII